jgi:hypothetical protein
MHYLLNKDLSLKAKGLFSVIIHLQDGGVQVDSLAVKHYSKESNASIDDAFRELQSHGYLVVRKRDDDGKIIVASFINNETK